MRTATLLFLIASIFASYANATGKPPPKPEQTQQQAQGQAQGQHQAQGRQGQAQGQHQAAHGGDQHQAQEQSANNEGVEVSNNSTSNYKRSAPSVSVWSSPSTAEFMQCFGLGGSSKDGAATGAWCRIQRDLYALHLSDRLADVGALEQAAIVYCSRRLHWKDMHGYDSKEACNSAYWAILEAQHDEVTNVRDRTTQLMLDEVVRDVNDHTSSEVERGTRRVVNKVEECSGCAGGKMGAAYDG